VAAYLARRGASPSQVRAVLSRLRAWGYLDDEAFALRWAQARVARRPMGRARLEAELLARGFDAETTAKTLRTIYADRTEAQLAEVLLAKASRQAPRSSARAAALLRRFGFEEESIESALGMDASL
jgi:SOS response regulatory protein OraA/RecX